MQTAGARPFVKSENENDDEWVELKENNFCIEVG
jgi:hypothetical protein